jgi:hypothetical protein
VLTWRIGVAAETGLRAFTSTNLSRVVVDVMHPEPGTGAGGSRRTASWAQHARRDGARPRPLTTRIRAAEGT